MRQGISQKHIAYKSAPLTSLTTLERHGQIPRNHNGVGKQTETDRGQEKIWCGGMGVIRTPSKAMDVLSFPAPGGKEKPRLGGELRREEYRLISGEGVHGPRRDRRQPV
jgi:hypothetical protein